MSLNKPLAFSYLRMSTDAQLAGDSRRRQLELSERYAEQNGLMLVTENRLEDIGVSAFKGANLTSDAALGGFLAGVREGKIPHGSYLLLESLDRLTRQDVFTSLALFTELITNGIVLVTLLDGQVYSADRADFSQLVVSLAIMSRAHDESQTKSRRLSEAWAAKRGKSSEKKLTALCPAWLTISRDRRSFVVDEERTEVVRSIFESCASGIGSFAIAKRLNESGVSPFGRSKGWQVSYVKKIISNRAVLGEFQPHRVVNGSRVAEGPPISGYFPAVVEEQLFHRAQAALSQRRVGGGGRKGRGVANLFSGLARCAYCGGPMHLVNKGVGPKGGRYLTCDQARRGLGCERQGWRYDDFEVSFLSFVTELDLGSLLRADNEIQQRESLERTLQAHIGRLSDLERQRDRTFRLLIEDEIAPEFLKHELVRFDAEISTTQAMVDSTRREIDNIRADVERFRESRSTLRSLIEKLRSDDPDDNYQLRSEIASRLKSLVSSLRIAAVGQRPFLEKAMVLVSDDAGRDSFFKGVRDQLADSHDEDTARERYFAISFRDKKVRIVHPNEVSDRILRQIYTSPDGITGETADGQKDIFLGLG